MIQLEPKEFTQTASMLRCEPLRISRQESVYATMPYAIWSDALIIQQGVLEFTKEELDTWGEDDSVLDDIVLNKLSLTRA